MWRKATTRQWEGMNTYCDAYRHLGDIPLAHVAVKLCGRRRNTAKREKARVRIEKNVAEGDDETAGEGMNTYCQTW